MFVPSIDLVDASQASLYSSLSFFGSVILKNGQVGQIKSLINQTGSTLYWAYAKSVDEAVQLWDVGVLKVIFDLDVYQQAQQELAGMVSEDRIAVTTTSPVAVQGVSTVIVTTSDIDAVKKFAADNAGLLAHGGEKTFVVELENVSIDTIAQLGADHVDALVPASLLTTATDDTSKLNIAEAFLATAKTDRPDGLYTTMVVDEFNKALGLVYSSKQSVAESIRLGQGVYQSRGRGLWHKGLTSGATQTLKHIDYDCDGDALRFVVEQHGAGKCGPGYGIGCCMTNHGCC